MTKPDASPRLLVVGANHRSSAASMRERLFVVAGDQAGFLARLRAAGLDQALLLATCDRVEVQAAAVDPEAAGDIVAAALAEAGGVAPAALEEQLYRLEGHEALRHVFAVASSLDSMVPGEAQVLGQVKEGQRIARAAGMTGPVLDAVLDGAYCAAKRVRTETEIGERPVSIAAAAERLARNVHGDLADVSALLIAGGEMGEMIAEHLQRDGLGELTVTARLEARAQMTARAMSAHFAVLDRLDDLLAASDVVISAVGAGEPLIGAKAVQRALAARRHRPIFLIDAAIPGDIDRAVDRIDDAFLYDLGDLESVAMEGRRGRDAAAVQAAAILEEEVAAFERDRAGRDAAPLAAALRRRFEAEREAVLAEAGGDAAEATRLMINRLLHGPMNVLREMGADGDAADRAAMEAMLRRLFGVEPGDEDDRERDGT
jgi:glutamyl-tRNA reductase